jgi:hypothetical protein
MPVRNPRVSENTRRIALEHFALAVELAHAVDIELALLCGVTPAAPSTRFEVEGLDLGSLLGPPLDYLLGVDQRLKNALRRGSDVSFPNDCICAGTDTLVSASGASILLSCVYLRIFRRFLRADSVACSFSRNDFRLARFICQKLRYCPSQESTAFNGSGLSW